VAATSEEARQLAQSKAADVAALSWEELDAYGKQEDSSASPSGVRFRVTTVAFWDMEDWRSDLYVITKVYPERGWRRWRPWKAVEVRGGPDDPVPARPDAAARTA
jgi:hypothetical protein